MAKGLLAASRYPLLAKLLILNIVLSVLAVGATGVLTYRVASDAVRREIIAAGTDLATNFARSNALEWLDSVSGPLNLKLRLASVVETRSQALVGAYVLDRTGKRVAIAGDVGRLAVDRLPAAQEGETLRVSTGEETITVAAAVVYDNVPLGWAVFGFSSDKVAEAGTAIFSRATVIIFSFMAFSALALLFALRRMLRPVVDLGHAAEEFVRGNYHHRISGELPGDEIGTAARSFNRMLDALELHMKFSNAALVERIRTRSDPERVSEHQLSIVFGDVVDFTRWTSRHPPAESVGMINRYYTCFGHLAVQNFHGIIDKFMGDGVMAHFGLLDPRGGLEVAREHVRDALRAAVYVQMAFRALGHTMKKLELGDPLMFRFGIATGRCLVGPIGAQGIMLDYTLLGMAVNLAARLETVAVGGGVAIDRFTQLGAGHGFIDVVDAGEQHVKGVDAPIEVFQVRGFADVVERQKMQQLLLDEFFTDKLLEQFLFAGRQSSAERLAEARASVRAIIERDPNLPV